MPRAYRAAIYHSSIENVGNWAVGNGVSPESAIADAVSNARCSVLQGDIVHYQPASGIIFCWGEVLGAVMLSP